MLRRFVHRVQHLSLSARTNSSNTPENSQYTNHPPISVRTVVVYMLGLTYGIKTADNTRRILLYSNPSLKHKGFFAVARSIYPVQEICSVLSALNYAKSIQKEKIKSDSTEKVKRRRKNGSIPYRSIFLHSMACLRGMKPLFVWDSSRPWDEIQLQAMNAVDSRSPAQLAIAGVLNFLWFGVLYKYLQVIVKKYFTLSREHFRQLQEEAFTMLSSLRRPESRSNIDPPLPPD